VNERRLIKAKKSLGQNFLVDDRITQRIIDSVSPKSGEIIFEIGPGTGALTRLLSAHSDLVVAVELDPRLVEKLRSEIDSESCLLVEADALQLDWNALLDSAVSRWRELHPDNDADPRLRIVANLPYYISTAIIERLLTLRNRIQDLTLMLQEEVVDRITSPPGRKDYGYLSVLVQFYCEASKLFNVPPQAFTPVPKVNSAIVKLTFYTIRPVELADERNFFAFVGAAFAQRRKTILNNLKAAQATQHFAQSPHIALEKCGIEARRRAETLSLQDFARLYQCLYPLE
jgi:16S rRNA (adenine1518-N6/adenine1519-N6)-dimethyltransferase